MKFLYCFSLLMAMFTGATICLIIQGPEKEQIVAKFQMVNTVSFHYPTKPTRDDHYAADLLVYMAGVQGCK